MGLNWALNLVAAWAPVASDAPTARHGQIMVMGFIGTLICLERIVALRSRALIIAPLALGAGGLALLASNPLVGQLLQTVDMAGLVVVYLRLARRGLSIALAILVPLARDTRPHWIGPFRALSVAAGAVWLLASLVVFGLSLIAGEAIVVLSSLGRYVLPILAGGVAQIVLGALGYLLPVVGGGGPTVYCLISALLPVTPAQAEAAPPPEIRRDGTRAPKPGARRAHGDEPHRRGSGRGRPCRRWVAYRAAGDLPTVAAVATTGETTEGTIEVAPGLTQNIWLFNAQMPGPTLHGRVGYTFVITLVNKGTMGHSIDFHAGALAPDEPMHTIEPGESLVYTFTATRSGI